MVYLTLAQGVTEVPQSVWNVVAQSGFNAVLILILLYFGRLDLALIRNSNDKNLAELRRSTDRSNKMITLALLQIASVPGLRQQLDILKQEIEQAERDDQNKP
jgi:hypothetical protein